MKQNRLIGIDILRILSAFSVFSFHAKLNPDLKYSFGNFNNFFSMGAVFMTAFFLLSGFVLCYTNYTVNMAWGGADYVIL